MNSRHLSGQEDATPPIAAPNSTDERRRSTRVAANREFARTAWEAADGTFRVGLACLLDVSEGGAALEMPDAPREGTWIRFACEKAFIFGTGRVCYITGTPGRFVIGVEFGDDMYWRAAAKRSYLTTSNGLRGTESAD